MRKPFRVVFNAVVLSIIVAKRVLCADIVGIVADTQAHPVANVRIVVKNLRTSFPGEARSNASGSYQLTGLTPGTYKCIVEPVGLNLKGGDAVSYLTQKGLMVNWRLSAGNPAIALVSEGTMPMLVDDPFGFSALAFSGVVLGGAAAAGGIAVSSYAAAGGFSGGSSEGNKEPDSDCDDKPLPKKCKHPVSDNE